MVEQLLGTQRFELVQAFTAAPSPRRGVSAAPVVDLMVDSPPGELHLLVVRRPSGAITFHVPVHTESAVSRATSRFSVPLAPGGDPSQRRGLVSLAAGIFVLKVAGLLAGKTVPVLARLWETAAWKLLQREEGWLRVSPQDLAAGSLPRLADFGDLAAPPERNLLLIHGTFSHAAAAFPELGSTPGASGQSFFQALAPVYGDRIFAFDHFTVSRTPEENARALLEALPDRPSIFDVITHSRGGLVLRYLAERRDRFGKMAERFQLGRAVLVASPNEGTPLASPQRFETFLGWLGNLVDYLPDGPPFALGFVSQGLAWLAQRIAGAIPGIAAMDSAGPVVAELQDQPGPAPGAYSALVSNFEPDANLLQRMVDAGVDAFFATANDLVVPTEGGWRVDPGAGPVVPGERIGCFGRSGNILTEGNGAVHHTNFFSRPESIDFLVRALRGEAQPLAPLDPNQDLAFRGRRGAVAVTPAPGQPPSPAPEMPVRLAPAGRLDSSFEDVFHLSILEESRSTGSNRTRSATLLATFRNAKVLDRIETGGGEAGRRW
ncbi:MAG: hypothetical protein HYR60_26560, partial [Acidobacteria bacterium]|nr:hypothetical protein [Acidobacteriota bacterium]